MHKLGRHTFKTDDGDEVRGFIVVDTPEDGDYSPGRNIGAVQFIVDNPDEQRDEKGDGEGTPSKASSGRPSQK